MLEADKGKEGEAFSIAIPTISGTPFHVLSIATNVR
jgi:hypothetical protein